MAVVRADFDDKKLKRNVRGFDDRVRNDIQMVVDRRAALATTWLRTNARWTDRTGAARSGLLATAHHTKRYSEIVMAYSVNYGIWLEVAHDRKWAVITPGLRIQGAALMKDLDMLIETRGFKSPAKTVDLAPQQHKRSGQIKRATKRAWRKKK